MVKPFYNQALHILSPLATIVGHQATNSIHCSEGLTVGLYGRMDAGSCEGMHRTRELRTKALSSSCALLGCGECETREPNSGLVGSDAERGGPTTL